LSKIHSCSYTSPNGQKCTDEIYSDEHCYWHDQSQKNDAGIIEKLEARARTGKPMIGFSLFRCNLEGINLVNHGNKKGYQLIHSDLYRANLKDAHFFSLDLTGTSLMKADLGDANLQLGNLTDTNLLGTKMERTHLTNVTWGKTLAQEKKAQKEKDRKRRKELYQESEETYRNLRKSMESQGLFEMAGIFFRQEMIMSRMQLPLLSSKWAISKAVDVFCGYGELPLRVVLFSVIEIITFAILYLLIGIGTDNGIVAMHFDQVTSLNDNLTAFADSLYFSVVTFTTLGYGDITPIGLSRALAALEAFFGSFTMALFVVVFVKKMTR